MIDVVNDKPVNNPKELVATLSSLAAGNKVRIGYMVRGQWQAETALVLGEGH